MLLAQRKKRQQLAGKIGHDDGEYEFRPQPNVLAQYGNKGCRHPPRRPDVNPISWDSGPPPPPPYQRQGQQQQQERLQAYDQLTPRRDPLFQPSVMPNASPGCAMPLGDKANNYRGNNPFSRPLSFPSVLPPVCVAPILPKPAVVSRSPLRFTSALEAPNLVSPSAAIARPVAALGCSPQLSPIAAPSMFPPITHASTPTAGSTPRGNDVGLINSPGGAMGIKNNINDHRPRSQLGRRLMSPYPKQDDDQLIARREARQQAIEIQNENARLCEERRLRLEREKRMEMEEQRRQEELARLERVRIGQKEQIEMERERFGEGGPIPGRRRSGQTSRASDSHLREDLLKQIEEKEQRLAEEARRLAEVERKEAERLSRESFSPRAAKGSTLVLSAAPPEKKDTELFSGNSMQQSTRFVVPPFSGVAAPFEAPLPFSFDPWPLGGLSAAPCVSFGPTGAAAPPPSPPPPVSSTGGEAYASAADASTWSAPPRPSFSLPPPGNEPLPNGAPRYESNLRDMINNHMNIQRLLESEVQRKPGDTAAPAPPAVPLTLSSSAASPAPFTPGRLAPLNQLPTTQNAYTPLNRGDGKGNNPELPSLGLPGALKGSNESSSRITILGVSPPVQSAAPGGTGAKVVSPSPGWKTDPDELSAEPSRFVGAMA